jgi:hypothetical protein
VWHPATLPSLLSPAAWARLTARQVSGGAAAVHLPVVCLPDAVKRDQMLSVPVTAAAYCVSPGGRPRGTPVVVKGAWSGIGRGWGSGGGRVGTGVETTIEVVVLP